MLSFFILQTSILILLALDHGSVFQRLAEIEKRQGGRLNMDFLHTHPSSEKRVKVGHNHSFSKIPTLDYLSTHAFSTLLHSAP